MDGAKMSNTLRQQSPLADLLENLIKHGTMPGIPIPKSIIDAQLELAEKNVTIDFMEKEINRLQAVEAAARELHRALQVTMTGLSEEGINLSRYLNLFIGDLKDADEALAAALEQK
jgi:two-component sensor histidine kinase